jgi:hypothetical protein
MVIAGRRVDVIIDPLAGSILRRLQYADPPYGESRSTSSRSPEEQRHRQAMKR